MDRLRVFLFFAGCGLLTLISLACPYVGPQYPVTYGYTPTPTPPPAIAVSLVGSGPFTFNPASVTISHGGSVTFTDTTNVPHVVYVDNGAGACAANYPVPNLGSVVVTAPFTSAGTYNYHCLYHSPTCGSTTCNAACTGMTGNVVAQ